MNWMATMSDLPTTTPTAEHDGLPDIGIWPLVVALNDAGFETLQSCYGHEGESDGHLWVRTPPVNPWKITGWTEPFSRIQTVHHGPEGSHVEFHWEPNNASEAMQALTEIYSSERGNHE